jgi:K+/H+ antiporter YhaU regulatory subunit KhtT
MELTEEEIKYILRILDEYPRASETLDKIEQKLKQALRE